MGGPRAEWVAVAFGSNVGDRLGHLRAGVEGLGALVRWARSSPVMETDPVGYVDQPRFLNAVAVGHTSAEPTALLELARTLEAGRGRVRSFPGAPRTLDVDLVLFGDRILHRPDLRIPHPRWKERPFVLGLLAEIAPEWVDPESGRTVEQLWRELRGGRSPGTFRAPPTAILEFP